jgi:hypothetical protein
VLYVFKIAEENMFIKRYKVIDSGRKAVDYQADCEFHYNTFDTFAEAANYAHKWVIHRGYCDRSFKYSEEDQVLLVSWNGEECVYLIEVKEITENVPTVEDFKKANKARQAVNVFNEFTHLKGAAAYGEPGLYDLSTLVSPKITKEVLLNLCKKIQCLKRKLQKDDKEFLYGGDVNDIEKIVENLVAAMWIRLEKESREAK